MNELKNRGVEDIIFAVVDGLKGFPDAITATFPRTTVQTCIVHLRGQLSFVSGGPQAAPAGTAGDLPGRDGRGGRAAARRLRSRVGQKYPAIAPAWRRVWTEVIPFFAYRHRSGR